MLCVQAWLTHFYMEIFETSAPQNPSTCFALQEGKLYKIFYRHHWQFQLLYSSCKYNRNKRDRLNKASKTSKMEIYSVFCFFFFFRYITEVSLMQKSVWVKLLKSLFLCIICYHVCPWECKRERGGEVRERVERLGLWWLAIKANLQISVIL